jgi:hypothetical protein
MQLGKLPKAILKPQYSLIPVPLPDLRQYIVDMRISPPGRSP